MNYYNDDLFKDDQWKMNALHIFWKGAHGGQYDLSHPRAKKPDVIQPKEEAEIRRLLDGWKPGESE